MWSCEQIRHSFISTWTLPRLRRGHGPDGDGGQRWGEGAGPERRYGHGGRSTTLASIESSTVVPSRSGIGERGPAAGSTSGTQRETRPESRMLYGPSVRDSPCEPPVVVP